MNVRTMNELVKDLKVEITVHKLIQSSGTVYCVRSPGMLDKGIDTAGHSDEHRLQLLGLEVEARGYLYEQQGYIYQVRYFCDVVE